MLLSALSDQIKPNVRYWGGSGHFTKDVRRCLRGVVTETEPADQNGVRPQRRYYYNQLYPHVMSSNGSLISSSPVWRLIKISECLSATSSNSASCVGTSQERVTTFAYDDRNLYLTSETVAAGDNSISATTTYSYDYAGDLTIVDGPRTDVDDRKYTTYDIFHRPVFQIGPDPDGSGSLPRLAVKHVYDGDGREYLTQSGTATGVDGSGFSVTSFTRRTFDATTGLLIKTEVVQP